MSKRRKGFPSETSVKLGVQIVHGEKELSEKLGNLHTPWDGDVQAWLENAGLSSSTHDAAHGTIGSGNHFTELQMIEKIYCDQSFNRLGLDKRKLFLLVHSGSRGLGEDLLRNHTAKFGADGLCQDTEEARK